MLQFIQSKIVNLQYEFKQYEFKLYAYVTPNANIFY